MEEADNQALPPTTKNSVLIFHKSETKVKVKNTIILDLCIIDSISSTILYKELYR